VERDEVREMTPCSFSAISLAVAKDSIGRSMQTMRKVAVFGNTGAGKSTLARRLAEVTGLSLYSIDKIKFPGGRYQPREKGGGEISNEEYVKLHADLLKRDQWIIDGFDSIALAWERFSVADTLVYIDLPVLTHYNWVTKRFIKGLFRNPEGWPENSPVWSSTLSAYRVVWRCHRRLTPRYRQLVADASSSKRVHHLKSPPAMKAFLHAVKQEHQRI
jgi:adenylate kinase family enzyme